MVTHQRSSVPELDNPAECYFWVFKEARYPAECPGPQIYVVEGARLVINVTNNLDGPHAFCIPGMVDTGPIAPGQTKTVDFQVKDPGSYLYYDNLNEPVNRVMGLHGAFIVMPKEAKSGHKLTPYKNPTEAVQNLFDDLGTAAWWPGLSWEQGDPLGNTPPTRQHIWLLHQASPVLFDEVGQFAQDNPGQDYSAVSFVTKFLFDPFVNCSNDPRTSDTAALPRQAGQHNRKPQFFTVNGQSGMFAHDHPLITPMYRVGEPALVRILNAGLWLHSMHLHANHFYVSAVNNEVQENPLWLDVFGVQPMWHVDYVIPFMRPPDVPNERGIGRADRPLGTCWPPAQELQQHFPPLGTMRTGLDGTQIDIAQRQSPLCYPMHDHCEPSQVAQGGNYNCGLISGIYFIGDRNGGGDFPLPADFQMMIDAGRSNSATGPAAGEEIRHDAHSHG
jgi:hypothetical protein